MLQPRTGDDDELEGREEVQGAGADGEEGGEDAEDGPDGAAAEGEEGVGGLRRVERVEEAEVRPEAGGEGEGEGGGAEEEDLGEEDGVVLGRVGVHRWFVDRLMVVGRENRGAMIALKKHDSYPSPQIY